MCCFAFGPLNFPCSVPRSRATHGTDTKGCTVHRRRQAFLPRVLSEGKPCLHTGIEADHRDSLPVHGGELPFPHRIQNVNKQRAMPGLRCCENASRRNSAGGSSVWPWAQYNCHSLESGHENVCRGLHVDTMGKPGTTAAAGITLHQHPTHPLCNGSPSGQSRGNPPSSHRVTYETQAAQKTKPS